MRLFSLGLIIWTFLSSVAPVKGIKAYRTDQISDSNPYYINFYLEKNDTTSRKGSAELCNFLYKTCEDVAELAPVSSRRKIPGSDKVSYSIIYPPHSKTHKQLVLLIHYDPQYRGSSEQDVFINNETTIFLEYQWTEDKIASGQ